MIRRYTSEPCPSPAPPLARGGQDKLTTKKGSRSERDRVCISSHEVVSDCESSARQTEPPAMGRTSPTLRRAWPKDGPLAAICVQSVDVQCVLQFTLIHAAGCVLHRRTSRVIHRLKLFSFSLLFQQSSSTKSLASTQRHCGHGSFRQVGFFNMCE